MTELRWLYDRRDAAEARLHLRAWLERWSGKYPKLCAWVEESIEETWTFYRQPREHHKHLKSTNLLERLNQELKRRTHVLRIFPNEQSCLRLLRALACEQLREAIRIEPSYPARHEILARLLATCPTHAFRDGQQAVKLATRACELWQWKNLWALDTLAAVCAEAGDFDKAIQWQRKFLATVTGITEEGIT